MIGPVPSLEPSGYLTTPHNAARVLAQSCQLGALRLVPGERQLVEYIRTLYAGGWQQSVFWPIHVVGTTESDSWPVVQREAARAVHTLVCLVSLAWNEAWQVRVAPQNLPSSKPYVPDDSSPPPNWPPGDKPQVGMRDEQDIPTWLREAWGRLETEHGSKPTAAALSLWHQGILLKAEHPSLALVAFVASVEQVGRVLSKLQGSNVKKPEALFWTTAGLVATPDDLALLRKWKVYSQRSATAHGRKVHGLEAEFGAIPLPLPKDSPDPVSEFVYKTVPQLGRTARDLLLRILT